MSVIGTNNLPLFVLAANYSTHATAINSLPLFALGGQGGMGATADNSLPVLTLTTKAGGRGQNLMPLASLAAIAHTDFRGAAANNIPRFTLIGAAHTDSAPSKGVNALPLFKLTAAAHININGVAANALPLFQIQSNVFVDVLNALTAQAFSINMNNGGNTEYTNFDFNSFCVFNGKLLGSNDNGIFALEGTDDNGTPITMTFRTGQGNFGNSYKKNVPDIYVSCQGAASLKTITDDNKESSVFSVQGDNFKSKRVKPPLGRQSVYWGVELSSSDPNCVVSEVELLTDLAQRR